MNARRLYYDDGSPATIWQCGKCGSLRTLGNAPVAKGERRLTVEERMRCAEAFANLCCDYKCEQCGVKTPQFQTQCSKCNREEWNMESARKEREAFAKAKERTDYDGPFVWNERVFHDMIDLLEHFDGKDVPEYVWVPEAVKLSMDADHIISNALDDHYEDASQDITDAEQKELQDFLDAWCEKTGIVSYFECHNEYVRIPKEIE